MKSPRNSNKVGEGSPSSRLQKTKKSREMGMKWLGGTLGPHQEVESPGNGFLYFCSLHSYIDICTYCDAISLPLSLHSFVSNSSLLKLCLGVPGDWFSVCVDTIMQSLFCFFAFNP